jgi:hypothetical protein
MVIGDLDLSGVVSLPAEDNAPLLVDTDGMETFQGSAQDFQAVPWRLAEIFKGFGFVNSDEFVIGPLLNIARELAGIFEVENLPALAVPEAQNHPNENT